MRGILLAMLLAAGIGLVGSAGVSAAPINGSVIGHAADTTNTVEQVQHWRWGSRGGRRWGGGGGHYRWGSRGGHYRYGSRGVRRCHRVYSSRFVPCW